jgi:hypothetical protein
MHENGDALSSRVSGLLRILGVLVAVSLLSCSRDPSPRPFSVANDPTYAHARVVVQALADLRGEPGQQHFCIVGIESDPGGRVVWVHWREGNALTLWEPSSPDVGEYDHSRDLIRSRGSIDLGQDVVGSQDEVGTSTYLVTREWVADILSACEEVGLKLTVEKAGS